MKVRLKRSLYGLKQAARIWNQQINSVFQELGFLRSKADPCLYVRRSGGLTIFVLIYVDDIIVVYRTQEENEDFVGTMSKQFNVAELKQLKFIL